MLKQGGCRPVSARPGGERRGEIGERQQIDGAAAAHRRALLERVVAPGGQEQPGRLETRGGPDGVQRLREVLDEPQSGGVARQAVLDGKAPETFWLRNRAPRLGADDRQGTEPRVLGDEER